MTVEMSKEQQQEKLKANIMPFLFSPLHTVSICGKAAFASVKRLPL